MWTLDTFYRSKEWQSFREVVIAERTAADGFIYDEETGKPIIRKYDIILHHKIFLTEENVNDRMISLNPDNIEIVSAATHNRIHNRLGYVRKEIYLVYGPPFAGKSTYIRDTAQPGDLIISMDSIWQSITGADRYTKPRALNSIAFGIRDFLLDSVRMRRGRWNNCYIAGGYALISERERLVRETGAREVFIDTDRTTCEQRMNETEGIDHSEYAKYIADWFEKYGRTAQS